MKNQKMEKNKASFFLVFQVFKLDQDNLDLLTEKLLFLDFKQFFANFVKRNIRPAQASWARLIVVDDAVG